MTPPPRSNAADLFRPAFGTLLALSLAACGGGGNSDAGAATSTGGGTSSGTTTGTLADCHSAAALTQGSSTDLLYVQTDTAPPNSQLQGGTDTVREQTNVVGSTQFMGAAAIRVDTRETFTQSGIPSNYSNYFSTDALGDYMLGTLDSISRMEYTPYMATARLSLKPGESSTYPYSITFTDLATGAVRTMAYSVTDTFEALDSVSTPAGTFKVCRVSSVTTITTAGYAGRTQNYTSWVGFGNGLMIKSTQTDWDGWKTDRLLQSGTVNGQIIKP